MAKKTDTKDTFIRFRIATDQFNAVSAKAKAAGLALGAYMRKLATGDEGPRARRQLPLRADLIHRARAELNKYAGNMNQIAKELNRRGSPIPPGLTHALKEWEQIRDAYNAVLGKPPAKPRP